MNSFHIIHIDDHQLFRDSLRNVLQKNYPFVDLYQFTNPDSAIEHIISNLAQRDPIDLVIADYTHIGEHGVEFAKSIRRLGGINNQKLPIVLLTMRMQTDEIKQAIQDGILSIYISKATEEEEFLAAINRFWG